MFTEQISIEQVSEAISCQNNVLRNPGEIWPQAALRSEIVDEGLQYTTENEHQSSENHLPMCGPLVGRIFIQHSLDNSGTYRRITFTAEL